MSTKVKLFDLVYDPIVDAWHIVRKQAGHVKGPQVQWDIISKLEFVKWLRVAGRIQERDWKKICWLCRSLENTVKNDDDITKARLLQFRREMLRALGIPA